MWQPIKIPKNYSRNKSSLKKSKYLFDHNIPTSIVEDLKVMKVNVRSLKSFGKEKKDDTEVFQLARQEDRVLVTKDKDFLQHKLFPLKLSPGIIILGCATLTFKQIVSRLYNLISLCDVFEKSKVVLHEDTMDLYSLSTDGRTEMNRYRFPKNQPVEIWVAD